MIRFAHLSDTHILKDYSKSNMKELFEKVVDRKEKLSNVLNDLDKQELDFIIISGDIVHEGNKEDYECLKGILDNNIQNTKVIMSLGNHDRKKAFSEVFLGEALEKSYYYVEDIKGLRIVVLDSAVLGREAGEISKEQEEWLREVLSTKSKEGTIIVLHHPIAWENEAFSIKVSEEFKYVLKGSDVIGIFCGHTHYRNVYDYGNIPQITAESMSFGIDFGKDTVSLIDEIGYNICSIEDKKVSVHCKVIREEAKELVKLPLEFLKNIK